MISGIRGSEVGMISGIARAGRSQPLLGGIHSQRYTGLGSVSKR